MSTSIIKQRLHHYIETAEAKKLKAFYTIVEADIENQTSVADRFSKELDQRVSDFESGKVKGISWADVKKRALKGAKK